jgi:hypothetical protein
MMQASFSDLEYAARKKVTRRDRFLVEIDAFTLWLVLVTEIAPFYPKGEGRAQYALLAGISISGAEVLGFTGFELIYVPPDLTDVRAIHMDADRNFVVVCI